MSTALIIKRRLKVFAISLVFIVLILVATFVIFNNNDFSQDVLVNNKNLRVKFENGKKGIQFGEYPMSFQQGISSSPANTFKIVNKSDFSTEYQVIVSSKSESLGIDINKIVVAINDEEVKLMSDVVNGIIYSGRLDGKKEDILNLKFWLDSEQASQDDMIKSLKLSVDIKEKWEN